MTEIKNHDLPAEEKIKSDALRLLSVRARSMEELRGRLKLKKYSAAAIESVCELARRVPSDLQRQRALLRQRRHHGLFFCHQFRRNSTLLC